MNASLDLGGVWQLAGWTMLHFLWLGALVAIVGGALRLACRRAAAGVRYAVSLATLAAIAATPIAIAAWLAGRGDALSIAGQFESRRDSATPWGVSPKLPDLPPEQVAPPVVIDLAKTPIPNPSLTSAPGEPGRLGPGVAAVRNPSPNPSAPQPVFDLPERETLELAVAYLPWIWLVGAPITFVLLAAGLVGSKRMRRTSTPLDAGPVAEACSRLRALMRISRRVIVAVSDAVAQPVLVGIVRPTILLPAAALSGWSPEELEMVLVHELAHVRRWDNLVNLVQRLVESLLFFHPAVWLASRQVRRDREECCDAAVVRHTERPTEYAELLVAIAGRARRARTRPAGAGLALASAMADHPLAGRIRRILNLEDESMRVSRGALAVAVTSIGLAMVAAVTLPHPLVNADEKNPAVKENGGEAPETKQANNEAVAFKYYIRPDAVKQMQPFVEQNHKKFGLQIYEWSDDYRTIRVRASKANQRRFQEAMRERDWVESPGRIMSINLPEQVLESETEVERTFELLEAQGFHPTASAHDIARASQNTVLITAPAEGVWKPVWETRMEQGEQIMVVRMVREDVRYQDPAAPALGSRSTAQPILPGAPGPVAVFRPHPVAGARYMQAGRKLQPGDQVSLDVVGAFPDRPLTNVYRIEPEGTLALGASYGRVPVAGHTVLEAEDLIKRQLSKVLSDVEVQLVLKEPAADVLIPAAAAPWPTTTSHGPYSAPTPASGWSAPAPALAEIRPTQVPTGGGYNARPTASPVATWNSAPERKKNAKEAEIEEKLRTPVQISFVDTPLAEAVSLLSDTAKVNIYIDPRGINAEALSIDVPVSLVLPNEISVKSALRLVLEPLYLTYVIEDEVVKITSEKLASQAAAAATSANPGNADRRYFYYDGSKATKPAADAPALTPQPDAKPATSTAPTPGTESPPSPATGFRPLPGAPSSDPAMATAPDLDQRVRYLYDGMTFDQWRQMWREELKTEKRTDAIEAMAAFGRAGYGREAIEAIFDVAGQYDFYVIDDGPEGKLKQRVIELLTTTSFSRLPETEWLPLLEERLKTDPKRWRWLAAHLLSSLRTDNQQVLDRLYELAKSGDKQLRNDVLVGLKNSDAERQDKRLLKLADELLASKDADDVKRGIIILMYDDPRSGGGGGGRTLPKVRSRPGLVDAAFHADVDVRRAARYALRFVDKTEAASAVELLLTRLDKAESKDERITALRALAAAGPLVGGPPMAVVALIDDKDLDVATAAAVAQDLIIGDTNIQQRRSGHALLMKRYQEFLKTASEEVRQDFDHQGYERELQAIFPTNREEMLNTNAGNGGGFF